MTPPGSTGRGQSWMPVVVGLAALALSSMLAVRVLSQVDWDVTIFGAFGEEATAVTEYAEERLGEVYLRTQQGHDGKFFFVQANDPWVLAPEENAIVLDRPLYSSQRMLYPVLAGGAGLFEPKTVMWAMLIVNLVAMGLGSWGVAALAKEMSGSPLWGLTFVLNPGFISEIIIGGAGIVAAACAFWALVFLMRGRMTGAIVLLTLAALTREAMLIAAAGSAVWLWRRGRSGLAIKSIAVPLAGVATWAIYLRIRLGWEVGTSQVQEIGLPFVGLAQASEDWLGNSVDLVPGLALVLLLVLYTRRVLTSGHLVGWAFLGFAPLALLFTERVWRNYFDITRAIAPVITTFVLLVLLARRERADRARAERTGVRL
jgi:hypothetical protein